MVHIWWNWGMGENDSDIAQHYSNRIYNPKYEEHVADNYNDEVDLLPLSNQVRKFYLQKLFKNLYLLVLYVLFQ